MNQKNNSERETVNLHSFSQVINVFRSVRKDVNNGKEKSTLMCLVSPYSGGRYGATWAIPARFVPEKFLIKYATMLSKAYSGFVYCRDYKLVEEELANKGVMLVMDKKEGLRVVRNVKKEEDLKRAQEPCVDDFVDMDSDITGFRELLNAPIPDERLPETWEEFYTPSEHGKRRRNGKNPRSTFHSEIGLDGVSQLCGNEEKGADDWLNMLLSKRIRFTDEGIILYAAQNVRNIFSSGDVLESVNVMKRLQKAIQQEIVKEEARVRQHTG